MIKSTFSIGQISKVQDQSYNNITKGQRFASSVNPACLFLIITSFAFYTYIDFRAAYYPTLDVLYPQFLVDFAERPPREFRIGDFIDNLPGRLVALTFGLIASRYYANIFAPLQVTGIPGWLQKATNLLLRANCITYLIPIMAAIVYDPKLWPICALIGTLFRAFNNRLCWLTARQSRVRAGRMFSLESCHRAETEAFLHEYREWWFLMLAYSFAIGLIGLLLHFGVAKDEKIYAGIVCGINMAKVYRNNCGREAPRICGNLSRMFFPSVVGAPIKTGQTPFMPDYPETV